MPPIKTLDELSEALEAKFTSRFDSIEAGIAEQRQRQDQLEGDIRRAFRSKSAPYVEGYSPVGDFEKDFSLFRALKGHMSDWDYPGYNPKWPERDLVHVATEKAQSTGVDTQGGFAVPAQFLEEFIPLLRANSVAIELGVQMLDGLSGSPVEIGKHTGGASFYWVDENEAPTESENAFGQLKLYPHGLAGLVKMSNRFVALASPGAESLIRNDLAVGMGLEIDRVILKGTGSSGEPLGMVNTLGISTTDFTTVVYVHDTGTPQTITDLLESVIGKLEDNNALRGRLGWAMAPAAKRKLHSSKDADGQKLFQRSNPNGPGTADQFYGYPYRTSTQLAAGSTADLIFANWQDVILGQWGTLVIDSSNVAGDAFAKRQVFLRTFQDVDVAVRHAKSVSIVTDWDVS